MKPSPTPYYDHATHWNCSSIPHLLIHSSKFRPNLSNHDNNYHNSLMFQCTYKPGCSNDFNTNANRVLEYKAKYGSGNYSCLYDAALGSTNVIRTRMLGSAGMLHALLWPSVFIAISLTCILFLLCACGTRYVCVTNPPRDVAEEANARMSKGTTNVAFQAPVHTLTVTPHY